MSEKALRHIGYIVDGNRRWAKMHGLPTYEGHLAGYNALKDIAIATFDQGIEYMSAYIFSTENWKRSEDEVAKLMGLVLKLLTSDLKWFGERNVKLLILGTRLGLPAKINDAIEQAERETAKNTGGVLGLCFNYGGQQEIVDAMRRIIEDGIEANNISPDLIEQYLYQPEIPALDLVVRTSGEMRLSNFMLWRSSYSELMFIDKMWPDMTKEDVSAIIEQYLARSRRFGG